MQLFYSDLVQFIIKFTSKMDIDHNNNEVW